MHEQILNDEKLRAEKPFPWHCPKCRQLTVNRVTMPYRCQRRHNGAVVTVDVPDLAVPRCSNCGEVVFDYVADEQIRTAFRTQFGPAEATLKEGKQFEHLLIKDSITPVFPVSDVEAASRYFCDKLGFTIQQATGNGRVWAVVSRGTSEIMLVPKDWTLGCCIRVDDVDEVCAELLSRQADFESGPTNQEYGRRDFLVRGPDGYEIGFWTPLKVERAAPSIPDEAPDDNVPF